ncbi:MAG: glycosyltransferase family 2 protein, partial [Bacilli bacterium]|nr:glycosyltransferase family 2 protein [Bacilli bacterium]
MSNKVSVIVPVYNAQKYLGDSISSLINQTYKNLEIIIIDDASLDNSKEIIKKYASLDKRIRPIYSEINQGVSKSRNIGLRTYTGDYVFFMDADDYIKENTIELMMNDAKKYNADLVENYHLIIYKNNNKEYKFTEKKVPKNNLVMGSLKDNIDILTKSTYITGKLIHKSLLKNLFFNEDLRRYEDLVFDHEIKNRTRNMLFQNKVLYTYYQVSNSLTNSLGKKHMAYLDASKEVLDIYKNSSKKIKDEIEALLFNNAFLTGVTKVIKNNDKKENNDKLLYDYLNDMSKIFVNYKSNKKINFILKIYFNKLINNKNKI